MDKQKKKRQYERLSRVSQPLLDNYSWLAIVNYCYLQKMTDRKNALRKRTFRKQEDRKKWEKVMFPEMISSEESLEENDEEVLKIRPLTWRAEIVNKMFAELDVMSQKEKSPQARRQQKPRRIGEISTRQPPSWAPAWSIARPRDM